MYKYGLYTIDLGETHSAHHSICYVLNFFTNLSFNTAVYRWQKWDPSILHWDFGVNRRSLWDWFNIASFHCVGIMLVLNILWNNLWRNWIETSFLRTSFGMLSRPTAFLLLALSITFITSSTVISALKSLCNAEYSFSNLSFSCTLYV